MTDQTPAPRSSNGNLWVIVPFVLAVIGTVVMLFTNSANALKVALIFALWAAAAGIMVIDRTRRDRDRAAAELAQARRQLAERAPEPAPAPEPAQPAPLSDADMAVIRELQEEIKALRAQLEEMRGAAFEYEPAAVRASARRIQELEEPERPEPERPAPRPGPSSDDTTRIAPVSAPAAAPGRPAGAPSADAVAGRLGQQPAREHPNPLSALISEREAQKPAPKPEPEHRGGRRRRDERGEGGLTVAELLARQQRQTQGE